MTIGTFFGIAVLMIIAAVLYVFAKWMTLSIYCEAVTDEEYAEKMIDIFIKWYEKTMIRTIDVAKEIDKKAE